MKREEGLLQTGGGEERTKPRLEMLSDHLLHLKFQHSPLLAGKRPQPACVSPGRASPCRGGLEVQPVRQVPKESFRTRGQVLFRERDRSS